MKDLLLSILNIFKCAGRVISFIRNIIFNTTLLFLIALLFFAYFISRPPTIPTNSILKLSLRGDIVEERRTTSTFERFLTEAFDTSRTPQYTTLQDILDSITTAALDPAINGILLDLKDLGNIGFNQMRAIGQTLSSFKHQGKKVFAAEDFYTQKQYYLASYADTIILNPMGGVEMHGLGTYPLYFKDALDKLQVNYHVFRVGAYKSAIEPIARSSMSPEARNQNLEWLNMLWDIFTNDVSVQRGLKAQAIEEYIDNIDSNLAAAGGDTAKLALDSHLVDRLLTREALYNYLKSQSGGQDLSLVAIDDYLAKVEPSYTATDDDTAPEIGIIVAEGKILGGEQPPGVIGSDSLIKQLQNARENPKVRGVVLRINSGGGSAFASEIIRQEILELKKSGKPVVVSMGAVAASGGYWISANADQIWASPVTLTGSIGIFGAVPTFERSLAHLGIYSDGVGTTKFAAGVNLTQPLKQELETSIQLTLNNGYNRFLGIVEEGRKIEKDKLSSIAEGRVFSGERAKELGLVDSLGSLNDAINAAAKLAGIEHFSPIYIERDRSLREEILQSFSASASLLFPDLFASVSGHGLYRQFEKQLGNVLLMSDPHNIYAYAILHPVL